MSGRDAGALAFADGHPIGLEYVVSDQVTECLVAGDQ